MTRVHTAYGQPARYNATPPSLSDNEGSALNVNSSGYLLVTNAPGSAFGASTADESTFTAGSTSGTISMGVYQTSPDTLTNNQAGAVGIDANRNLKVTLATLIAGEDLTNNVLKVEERFSYVNITTTTTTTVKSGAGFLHALIINTPVASSAITIYDNIAASGTKIGTITLPGTLLMEGPNQAIYDVTFATGLTIVTGTGASDITVSYR